MRIFFTLLVLVLVWTFVGCGDMNNPIQPNTSPLPPDGTIVPTVEGDDGTIIFNDRIRVVSAGLPNPIHWVDSGDGVPSEEAGESEGEILPDEVRDGDGDGGTAADVSPDAVTDGDSSAGPDVVVDDDGDDSLEPDVVDDGGGVTDGSTEIPESPANEDDGDIWGEVVD
ncbi:MAG: hypothetical protein OXB96_01285 [Candidatus Kaiserbacteria bacterium]|nr:hypothetical protein [Candidatus Kaiserbacteria bacterium]